MSVNAANRIRARRVLALAILLGLALPLWHSSVSHLAPHSAATALEHSADWPFGSGEAFEETCPVCAAASQQVHNLDTQGDLITTPWSFAEATGLYTEFGPPMAPQRRSAPPRAPPQPSIA